MISTLQRVYCWRSTNNDLTRFPGNFAFPPRTLFTTYELYAWDDPAWTSYGFQIIASPPVNRSSLRACRGVPGSRPRRRRTAFSREPDTGHHANRQIALLLFDRVRRTSVRNNNDNNVNTKSGIRTLLLYTTRCVRYRIDSTFQIIVIVVAS